MSWVRFEDTFPEHPKVIAAGGDAAWLHVCATAWANRHLKARGVIPRELVPRLSDRKNPMVLAAKLVEVGIWKDHPTGYEIHDYHEFQPTAEKVEEIRRKRAEAGRKGGLAGRGESKPEANCLANAEQTSEAFANPDPTRPDTYSFLDTQPSQSVSEDGRSVDNRRTETIRFYAEHAARVGNAKNPKAYADKAAARISQDPELDRLLELFPTAPADAVAAWLHGDKGSQRYYDRADELAPIIELHQETA